MIGIEPHRGLSGPHEAASRRLRGARCQMVWVSLPWQRTNSSAKQRAGELTALYA
jgi:hypothetical protein